MLINRLQWTIRQDFVLPCCSLYEGVRLGFVRLHRPGCYPFPRLPPLVIPLYTIFPSKVRSDLPLFLQSHFLFLFFPPNCSRKYEASAVVTLSVAPYQDHTCMPSLHVTRYTLHARTQPPTNMKERQTKINEC